MDRGEKKRNFTRRDYISLAGAIFLACVIWLIHNLSLNYSEIVRYNIMVDAEKDGCGDCSENYSEIAARCEMDGYSMLSALRAGRGKPRHIQVSSEDLHLYSASEMGSTFYMTAQDLQNYSDDIYGDMCKVEHFLADTVYFFFSRVEYVKVPVVPVTEIEFKSQYMADEAFNITPDSVMVYGDVNQLRGIECVNTVPISCKGVDSDIIGEAELQSVNGLRMSAHKVDYFQSVTRYVEFEDRVPVRVRNVPEGIKINTYPSSAVIKLRNYYPVLVEPKDFEVVIDYEDFIRSRSGYCMAKLADRPVNVITYELIPEAFECIEM